MWCKSIIKILKNTNGHIHNQATQKDGLMKKRLKRTILDYYYIYYFMIIGDWYMTVTKMMSF